jgi:hypothetical protein
MNDSAFQKSLTAAGLLLGIALIVIGARRSYEVEPFVPEPAAGAEEDPSQFEPTIEFSDTGEMIVVFPEEHLPPEPVRIGDWQMIEATTFTGIARKDGKLWLTYDPSQPAGKRACPT